MEYPVSFNNARVYSVPDTRFMRHGFALQRPAAVLQPSSPVTPVNMLPYQVAAPGVPYGYTIVPQPVLGQPMLGPGQRLVPVAGGRNVYSLVNDDEDLDEEYAPPPPRPRSRILDDDDNPEMEAFSATTRQIRKDANAILQRLSVSKPKSKASDFFKTYDYDTRSLTPRYLAPPPDRSHLRNTSPSLDEEPDPFLQSLRPGRRSLGVSSTRPVLHTTGGDRIFTPSSITANRIQNLYKELDEPLYAPEIRSFDYTECLRRDREAATDKVRGDVNRRATLMEPSLALGEARERRSSLKRERLGYDSNSVRSNINIRAQYAAMRAAAGRNIRIPTSEPAITIPPPPSAASRAPRPSSP